MGAPGWYPDAADPRQARYWDGQRWSEPVAAPSVPGATPAPPASGGGGGGGAGRVVLAIAAVVVLALAAGVGIVLGAQARDDDEATADTASTDVVVDPSAPAAAGPGDGGVPSSCPGDANRPEVLRYWQDASGTHVVIVIHTTCAVDQVLADPSARFGLFLDGDHLVAGTFDLSQAGVAVPAGGTSGEVELVFDGEADSDAALRSRVFLASTEADAQRSGFDLRYVFVCTPTSGGEGGARVDSHGGADLGGGGLVDSESPAPTSPQPASEDAALAQLEQIHADDAAARSGLEGQWVPQVSAKRLDADATVDILTGEVLVHSPTVFLNKVQSWRARFPGRAVLLRGSDFRSICGDDAGPECLDLWIVAVAAPHAAPEEIFHGWCESERLNYLHGERITDSTQLHCIAKRYSGDLPTGNSYAG